ncbi:DNA mismatch repair endonuclease MutL [Metabacillus arenae]|uniref:DNA mismatch repair protein MutL n=1 Tax=Metabacillus arenae TaxID=2771434 RepID=A0A926NEE3_9BACI|nr:DNA mismatch repair endonuclease MutL [Metabacillus arenae]MBD1379305.1 DNA mismatch repair endonuclease MutL [Metabacillus arenae]
MGKIIQLNDHLSNKIAAGEVVERPASVVKELVENSLDANSSIIEIEVEEAGLSKIRIVDNGDGIEADDCLNAFHRHATSKIKDENDLFRIRTLGFRGEALPSIASVSELELKTSTGSDAGSRIKLSGGKVIIHEPASSRKGTEIVVSDLFFNTPARLKYMKSIHTELGNITDVVNRLALSHPEVSFRLLHNGKQLLYTNGKGDVRQVLASIYGLSIAKKMIPIHLKSLDFEIKGHVSLPEITRASRNYISTIINGRFIKNYALVRAIQQGFHTLLPIGRFPIIYLEILMDPLLVDVNVHPAKMEVRLSKEMELNELITSGIKDTFKQEQLIPEVSKPTIKAKKPSEQQFFTFHHQDNQAVQTSDKQEDSVKRNFSDESKLPANEEISEKNPPDKLVSEKEESNETTRDENFQIYHQELTDSHSSIISEKTIQEENQERMPPLYPIGQMHGTYILAQNDRGLYIVDQHAAQERIKYEYYREKVGEIASEVQELLVPLTMEFSSNDSLIIDAHIDLLKSVGIFLESFGRNSYIVRSHPQWFPKGNEESVIEEIIQQVIDERKIDIKKLREEAAIMMSCKASIKANQHLRNEEIFALLESLRKTEDPFTCPHGRPIIVHYSTYEMEKMFKRVM